MKSQRILLIITFIFAFIIILDEFLAFSMINIMSTEIKNWSAVIGATAIGLAIINLIRIHARRIALRRDEWINSLILLIVMVAQLIIGLYEGSEGVVFYFGFEYIMTPLGATMYAMLAFWIASAAYRGFVARSIDSVILLVAATIVLLGSAPIGQVIWFALPVVKTWIMNVPNMAVQRAIVISGGIGAVSMGLRILMGIERGHLGGGE